MDPFRLTVTVTHADGSVTRWAEDELDPENQPSGLNFTTQNPGGFGTFTLTLPRGLEPGPDEALLDSVTITGPGNRVAYEGRIHRLPRDQGDTRTVTVTGVGWSSHLSDHRAFREIYVDRRREPWEQPTYARQINLHGGGFNPFGSTVDVLQDGTYPAVRTGFNAGAWSVTELPVAEAWYDARGIPIGSVYYEAHTGPNIDTTTANWVYGLVLATDDVQTLSDSTGSIRSSGVSDYSGTLTATDNDRTFASPRVYYSAAKTSTDTIPYDVFWRTLCVFGNHGLTQHAAQTDTGFYASQIIQDVIQRCAPKLNVGTLEDSGYIIPQLTFLEPTSPEQVILEVNKTQLYDWFVWEDREFTIVNPDPNRLTWQARLADGASPSLEGDDVVQLASSAYVYFTDVDGKDRIYGPTGAEFCDYTSDLLLGDGYDPYTDHGINAPITFRLSTPATPAQALQIGRIWLAEQNAPTRSGQIKISGLVEHPTEGRVPSWRVRAGDYVQIMDRVGDVPRKIVSTSYDHPSRTVTCTMQSGPLFRIEGLLARFGVEIGVLG